jgi:hypothetical protein
MIEVEKYYLYQHLLCTMVMTLGRTSASSAKFQLQLLGVYHGQCGRLQYFDIAEVLSNRYNHPASLKGRKKPPIKSEHWSQFLKQNTRAFTKSYLETRHHSSFGSVVPTSLGQSLTSNQ